MVSKKEQFIEDIQKIYDQLTLSQEEQNRYFDLAKGREYKEAKELVDNFLEVVGAKESKEAVVASLTYLINLREDSLEQLLKSQGFSQEQIDIKLELAYKFNANRYLERFDNLINFIEEQKLLTPFYRALIGGIHSIGESFTKWQSRWKGHIINGINRELYELFKGDEDKIFTMLQNEKLLDCKDGKVADRCYSVLVNKDGKYIRLSYAEAFEKEVSEIAQKLDILIDILTQLEDEVYRQKREWIEYFKAIKKAYLSKESDSLVSLWADVDRAWMSISTPLQVGHPLEYYEDKYRKAVALEWDLRIVNPKMQKESSARESIKMMAVKMANSFSDDAKRVIANNLQQVDRAQLYIGQPMLYYGAELNGLFSAQVVPNDEEVSSELGKKIFAYIDFVRESKKAKPIMQLSVNIFGVEFVQKQKNLINKNPTLWNRVYDLSTIGHEFGHILWIDSDTEVEMNRKGQFKNIEEFKATTGGIMAFFESEDKNLIEPFLDDIVSRAIGLMAWREVDEVLPYYCEGLIHLELLHESKLIDISGEIVEINYENYSRFKEIYTVAYKELAKNYLEKVDASEYLNMFTEKKGSYLLPKTEILAEFVEDFYEQYQKIGNVVAKEFI